MDRYGEPQDTGINWKGSGKVHPTNSMPLPYVEITMEEYMEKYVTDVWGIVSTNYKQVLDFDDGMWTFQFINYHDSTYAVGHKYMQIKKAKKLTGYMFYRGGKKDYDSYVFFTRFYRIGCKHEIEGMTLEEIRERGLPNCMFDHHYICRKCGYTYSTESSG